MSRRKRYSEQTAQEIKDIARRLMAEKGTAGLSIRAIAREIEMTPPALYTYYENLDALITALILDAFNAYADALEVARKDVQEVGGSLTEQLMAVTMAYRAWALTYPTQFQLIYGSPIPGYEAPAEQTLPAVLRAGTVFMGLMTDMWQQQELPIPEHNAAIPQAVRDHFQERYIDDDSPEYMVEGFYQLYGTWVLMHGMVTLEVFNHLQGTVGDTEAFIKAQMEAHYRRLGVDL